LQASSFCLRAICRRSHFGSRAVAGARHGPPKLCWKFEVARQASSPRPYASVQAVPWADEAEQQLSRLAQFWLRAICRHSHFRSRAAGDARHGPPTLLMKFEMARQARSPRLCASVRAVQWADYAEQQLSRVAPSGCELSAGVRIFRSRAAGGARHRPPKIR